MFYFDDLFKYKEIYPEKGWDAVSLVHFWKNTKNHLYYNFYGQIIETHTYWCVSVYAAKYIFYILYYTYISVSFCF